MATRTALGLILGLALAASSPHYGEWSDPVAVGPPVNTTGGEGAPYLSKNWLSLYIVGTGPDGSADVLVAQRLSLDDPWGTPLDVAGVNTPANDNNPALSADEHRLYISSNRAGTLGGHDLWVSRRHSRVDDMGWGPPVNLGATVNSTGDDIAPTFFEDELGVTTMYFSSNRAGLGGQDIYASTQLPDGTFSPAVRVDELSSTANDQGPHVRKDGLEIFFASNRPGTRGQADLMVATRARTADPWGTPQFMGAPINTPFADLAPGLSFDGLTLFYASAGVLPGATGPCSSTGCTSDLYYVTRGKLRGTSH